MMAHAYNPSIGQAGRGGWGLGSGWLGLYKVQFQRNKLDKNKKTKNIIYWVWKGYRHQVQEFCYRLVEADTFSSFALPLIYLDLNLSSLCLWPLPLWPIDLSICLLQCILGTSRSLNSVMQRTGGLQQQR